MRVLLVIMTPLKVAEVGSWGEGEPFCRDLTVFQNLEGLFWDSVN